MGVFYAHVQQVGGNAHAAFPVEMLGQPTGGHIDMLRNVGEGDIFPVVTADIAHGLQHGGAEGRAVGQAGHDVEQFLSNAPAQMGESRIAVDGENLRVAKLPAAGRQ